MRATGCAGVTDDAASRWALRALPAAPHGPVLIFNKLLSHRILAGTTVQKGWLMRTPTTGIRLMRHAKQAVTAAGSASNFRSPPLFKAMYGALLFRWNLSLALRTQNPNTRNISQEEVLSLKRFFFCFIRKFTPGILPLKGLTI